MFFIAVYFYDSGHFIICKNVDLYGIFSKNLFAIYYLFCHFAATSELYVFIIKGCNVCSMCNVKSAYVL